MTCAGAAEVAAGQGRLLVLDAAAERPRRPPASCFEEADDRPAQVGPPNVCRQTCAATNLSCNAASPLINKPVGQLPGVLMLPGSLWLPFARGACALSSTLGTLGHKLVKVWSHSSAVRYNALQLLNCLLLFCRERGPSLSACRRRLRGLQLASWPPAVQCPLSAARQSPQVTRQPARS